MSWCAVPCSKPILLSVMGKVYDVGISAGGARHVNQPLNPHFFSEMASHDAVSNIWRALGAGVYGTGGQYHCFAGKEIAVACAKFNKTNAKLLNTKWLNLSKDERALLLKWEKMLVSKYPEVGVISDLENLAAAPAGEGITDQADAFSTQLGLGLFAKGHVSSEGRK